MRARPDRPVSRHTLPRISHRIHPCSGSLGAGSRIGWRKNAGPGHHPHLSYASVGRAGAMSHRPPRSGRGSDCGPIGQVAVHIGYRAPAPRATVTFRHEYRRLRNTGAHRLLRRCDCQRQMARDFALSWRFTGLPRFSWPDLPCLVGAPVRLWRLPSCLDFRGYAARSSQATRMTLISSGVGWSGRDALNLAAMMTRRSLPAMSAVEGWALVVYQGARARCSPTSAGSWPAVAYQQVGYDPNPKADEGTHPEQQECRLVIAPHREQEHERSHACVKRACRRDHSAGPQNWLLGLAPGRASAAVLGPAWRGCRR